MARVDVISGVTSVIQTQLNHAVARATGDCLSTIRSLGFIVLPAGSSDLEPEDLDLRLDCPFCGHDVPYPGRTGDGAAALAECARCDVYFDYAAEEVYAVEARPRSSVRLA
jgi:hypothetical protein